VIAARASLRVDLRAFLSHIVGMKGAPTKPTRKEAAAPAAAAEGVDYVPSYGEFVECLVLIAIEKKLPHPEAMDFAKARIIPAYKERSMWGAERSHPVTLVIPRLTVASDEVWAKEHNKSFATGYSLDGSTIRTLDGSTIRRHTGGRSAYYGMPSAAELRAVAREIFPQLRDHFPQFFDDTATLDYTGEAPPSETADTPPQLRMREDFNTAVKQARAQVFRRDASELRLAAASAAYKAMLKNVDLLNARLPESERLTRARRLVRAYERLRKRNPAFEDHSKQLLAAFSIINKVKYRGSQAKAAQKAALAM
jgi:hypothetical protein